MSLRLIMVTAEDGYEDTLTAIAQQADNVRHEVLASKEGRTTVSMLVAPHQRQDIIDDIQRGLGGSETWQMVVMPVEAAVPLVEEEEDVKKPTKKTASQASREELYDDVEKSARIDANYITLVVLSTITVAIGLIKDNIAVVIGAMVIAPLLGPNLALTFGASMGNRDLIVRAAKCSSLGVGITLALSYAIGLGFPFDRSSHELLSRTDVGLESAVLALASGAAAALSLVTGLSSTLVGVMVAVALLPPAATVAIMASADSWDRAIGAALLLAVNIVCVNLAGQIVFYARGVRPRTGAEKAQARLTSRGFLALWLVLLFGLVALVVFRG